MQTKGSVLIVALLAIFIVAVTGGYWCYVSRVKLSNGSVSDKQSSPPLVTSVLYSYASGSGSIQLSRLELSSGNTLDLVSLNTNRFDVNTNMLSTMNLFIWSEQISSTNARLWLASLDNPKLRVVAQAQEFGPSYLISPDSTYVAYVKNGILTTRNIRDMTHEVAISQPENSTESNHKYYDDFRWISVTDSWALLYRITFSEGASDLVGSATSYCIADLDGNSIPLNLKESAVVHDIKNNQLLVSFFSNPDSISPKILGPNNSHIWGIHNLASNSFKKRQASQESLFDDLVWETDSTVLFCEGTKLITHTDYGQYLAWQEPQQTNCYRYNLNDSTSISLPEIDNILFYRQSQIFSVDHKVSPSGIISHTNGKSKRWDFPDKTDLQIITTLSS